ncbi:hypothetical protein [Ligilactobacillus aviarius]|uniref:Uncharacterized protein n=1 Tax=Ligilactobacillus aviarius TaxID=1606 RepID=A0A179C8U9_9LACO|nr:hypothetical protein [Ligilactobacillus aviarius]OAP97428.1 hypothetical protein A3O07_01035 [Ligilactobacillus aviarius]OAQ00901.1 hypothetical protein A3O09_03795 [Ligilactobacillus aviarius]OAQ01166.1 hypothetical protein A3O08_02680 [Ligilactobacillus aviarius]OAQ06080.1 hypothetical protein A3O13_02125 [Ligilactobacillus aviarius]OAQ08701.1 hypothetical protein A3O14_03195 [Ligilactobacillus aviarius]
MKNRFEAIQSNVIWLLMLLSILGFIYIFWNGNAKSFWILFWVFVFIIYFYRFLYLRKKPVLIIDFENKFIITRVFKIFRCKVKKINFENIEKISIIGKINPISRVPLGGPIGDFKISLKNEDSVNGSLYFLTKENFKELEEACSRLKKNLKEKLF